MNKYLLIFIRENDADKFFEDYTYQDVIEYYNNNPYSLLLSDNKLVSLLKKLIWHINWNDLPIGYFFICDVKIKKLIK